MAQRGDSGHHGAAVDDSRDHFPKDFIFGVATSAYQVEGGRIGTGKGDSIWDVFSETEGNILDGSSGDVAVDQYNRYKDDVELIAELGFDAYRFSISWSRIYPDGLGTEVNKEGIAYYNNLINALLEKGIKPFVTLYHWDLPYNLHKSIGGWLNEKIVEYFAIYAETCFVNFGDRVRHWITFNEPLQTSINGYGTGMFAPGRKNPSSEPYLVGHHQLLAHAASVDIYRSKYKDKQGGKIGLVVDCEWAEAFSDAIQDKAAAQRHLDFQLGWYLDPIFFGDYPKSMRERLGNNLPEFSVRDKELLYHSIDFVGLNHYTSRFIAHGSYNEDEFYHVQQIDRIDHWPEGEAIGLRAASDWLYVVPWGLHKVLKYIAERYENPVIYITENGMDDEDGKFSSLDEMLDDQMRVEFYKGYLAFVVQAVRDGIDVRGYFAWSLLDNFEWAQGFTKRFGLVYVDYKNGLSRHPKSSAFWFSRFLKGDQTE